MESIQISSKETAERAGFEPAIHFWRIHAFQACLFNHSSISPHFRSAKVRHLSDISKFFTNFPSKCYFLPGT